MELVENIFKTFDMEVKVCLYFKVFLIFFEIYFAFFKGMFDEFLCYFTAFSKILDGLLNGFILKCFFKFLRFKWEEFSFLLFVKLLDKKIKIIIELLRYIVSSQFVIHYDLNHRWLSAGVELFRLIMVSPQIFHQTNQVVKFICWVQLRLIELLFLLWSKNLFF